MKSKDVIFIIVCVIYLCLVLTWAVTVYARVNCPTDCHKDTPVQSQCSANFPCSKYNAGCAKTEMCQNACKCDYNNGACECYNK